MSPSPRHPSNPLRVASRHLRSRAVFRRRYADTVLTEEWVAGRRKELESVWRSPINGGDFAALAEQWKTLHESLVATVEYMEKASGFHPYFLRDIEWVHEVVDRIRRAAGDFLTLDRELKELARGSVLGEFVDQALRARYRREVKTVGGSVAAVPYLAGFKLDKIFADVNRKMPPEIDRSTLNPEMVRWLKSKEVLDRVLRNAFVRYTLGNPVEVLDKLLQSLRDNPRTDEGYGVAREVTSGRAKILLLDSEADPAFDAKVLETFEQVRAQLQEAGFGSVWYGVMFYAGRKSQKLTGEALEAARKNGYDISSYDGLYQKGPDYVIASGYPAEAGDVLAHELGHRYWHHFMSREQRLRFQNDVKTRPQEMTPEFEKDYLERMDYLPGELDDEGHPKEMDAVTYYGGTNAHEAFAEAFQHYVRGRHMSRDQRLHFRRLLGLR